MGGFLIFIGLIALLVGVISLIKPLNFLRITTRKMGAVVLVSGLVILMVGASLSSVEDKPVAEPEEVVEEEPEPEIEPETEAEPEPEIEPETEAEPEQEPEPETVSVDEEKYISLMVENSSGLGEALTKLGELALAYEPTDDWVIDAALQVTIIRDYAKEAEQIEPPEKFKEVHATYLQGTRKYKESMNWFVEGVDESDVGKIDKAGELMGEGTYYIEQATDLMLAIE